MVAALEQGIRANRGLGEARVQSGSWSQSMRKNERRLSKNPALLFWPTLLLFLSALVCLTRCWSSTESRPIGAIRKLPGACQHLATVRMPECDVRGDRGPGAAAVERGTGMAQGKSWNTRSDFGARRCSNVAPFAELVRSAAVAGHAGQRGFAANRLESGRRTSGRR